MIIWPSIFDPTWGIVTLTSMKLAINFPLNRTVRISAYRPWSGNLDSEGVKYYRFFRDGDEILLESTDPSEYPLPSATLLHIRSSLARVAFPAGAGQRVDLFE